MSDLDNVMLGQCSSVRKSQDDGRICLLVFGGRPELALMVTTGVSGVVCGGAVCHNRRAAPGQRETRQAMPRGGSIKEKMARKLKNSAPKRTPPKKKLLKKVLKAIRNQPSNATRGEVSPLLLLLLPHIRLLLGSKIAPLHKSHNVIVVGGKGYNFAKYS